MTERSVRWFRLALLPAGAAWRLFLTWPVRHWDSAVVSLAIGLVPYGLLAALAPRMGRPAVLWTTGLVALGIDIASGSAAMTTASSTGAVAVLIGPLVSAGVVVPICLVIDRALKRALPSL